MKDIEKMTVSEIAAEIRNYKFQKDKGYAFISYSHRDREQVYPLVLFWLRAGYNIYIDLDFERHGSDSNWADLMLSTLSSRLCRLVICFKSLHYRYSYASLLELLTTRGETVTNRHSGKPLCVDSIALETIPDDDEVPERLKETYAASFQAMSSGMGDQFLGQNRKEANLMREGLEFWLGEAKTKSLLRSTVSAEKMMGYIQDAYQAGYQDFFPQIAYLVKNWFISQDLNGNDYSLNSSMVTRFARFDEVRVEQIRENSVSLSDNGGNICPHFPLFGKESKSVPCSRTPDTSAKDVEYAPTVLLGEDEVQENAALRPKLIRRSTGEIIPLSKNQFQLGRSVVCDYQIVGNNAVGRIHAVFFVRGGTVTITDHHSKNFTFLNGEAIQPDREYPLQDGDSIRISSETFLFYQ